MVQRVVAATMAIASSSSTCVTTDMANLAMQWHGKRGEMNGKEGAATRRINEGSRAGWGDVETTLNKQMLGLLHVTTRELTASLNTVSFEVHFTCTSYS